jgi:putative ABC transport system permease protein
MRTFDIVRRAGRSLKHAKIRTILTSLSIAVGAFTLTIAIAAGEGARQYTDTLLSSNIDPQILVIAKEKNFFEGGQSGPQEYSEDSSLMSRPGANPVAVLDQEDVDNIEARDDISSISPSYTISAEYIAGPDLEHKYTVDVVQYDMGITQEVVSGELPELRTSIEDDQIAIPEAYVELLGFDNPDETIGKELTIRLQKTTGVSTQQGKDFTYEVVAVVGRSATALTATDSVQVSNSSARAMSNFSTEGTPSYQKYVIATASVVEGVDPAVVKAELVEQGYGVQTAEDLQSLLFTIVNTLQGIVIGFGILALITSVFGIINTQYISVLERTREIGLMKALGMRGRHVSRLFQFEAAWIGFLGGVIGSLLAVFIGVLSNPAITEQLTLGEDNYLLVFEPLPIVLLVVALMVIAMVAGLLPARKAAKLDPIEALRTE